MRKRLWIVVLLVVGKKLYSERSALGAALLMAVLSLHVLHSHYATVDVPVTFLITLSFLFATCLLERRKLTYYLGAGLAAGLAAGTKYTGIFTLSPLLAAHFLVFTFGGAFPPHDMMYNYPLISLYQKEGSDLAL